MHEYWHVILESLIEVAKILPFLFIIYYIIEIIEYKQAIKIQNSKLLKGEASPIFGSLLGCIPQCGFSVVSTDLYNKGIISVGALIAVYIATSDEAIPILLSHPTKITWLIALIAVKIALGILVGYLSLALYKLIFKNKKTYIENHEHKEDTHHDEHHNHIHEEENHSEIHTDNEHEEVIDGCCKHHVKTKSFDWLHPLLHCIKIATFILIINILFGFITHIWVGEDNLIKFLSASKYAQPVLAILIGLIPNCASSVALTELFVMGGLTFSSLVAGLSVNAGLGLIMLIKNNKNWKEIVFILVMLIVPSLIVGYGLIWI